MDVTAGSATTYGRPSRARLTAILVLASVVSLLLLGATLLGPLRAYAAGGAAVDLGTVGSFSVIAGSEVTNTGPSVLSDDVGLSPGTAITGFPPGLTLGTEHATDAVASQAKLDLKVAYDDAAGRASTESVAADIGGRTLVGGVYTQASALQLTGTLTLDGEDDPNSVFIFQIGSAFTTATDSRVRLINGAQACNVFYKVGSSATLGVRTAFVGTIMALTSVTVNDAATVDGRALARNGAVTLDNNVFRSSTCRRVSPSPSPTTASPTTASPSPTTASPTSTSTSRSPSPTATTRSPSPTRTSSTPTATSTRTDLETETASPTSTKTSKTTSASATSTKTALETESASATSTESGGTLAATGTGQFTTWIGIGGVALVIAAGAILAVARTRSRPHRRH